MNFSQPITEGLISNRHIKICLFLTHGMSLKAWEELGILDREIYLYNELVNRGVETTVFTYGTDEDSQYVNQLDGIKIIPAYCQKIPTTKIGRILSSLIIPFKFRSYFKKSNILKTNQMQGAWVPLIAKWLTGNKLLVRCGFEQHQFLVAENAPIIKRWFYYFLSKSVYKNGDAIIVTSSKIAEYIHLTFAIDMAKISVYSNVIDTKLFRFFKIYKKAKKLLFVGRLNSQKNLFNLISAVKKVELPLTIVGEGELLSGLQEHAIKIGAKVTFLGSIPNPKIPELITEHNLFILPSFYEGNPKALLEAMSCGRAVIGTDVPGIRNIISHRENGLLCGTEVDQIAGAIDILHKDINLQQTLGKNARRYVENNCSVEKIVSQEIAVIRRLLNE